MRRYAEVGNPVVPRPLRPGVGCQPEVAPLVPRPGRCQCSLGGVDGVRVQTQMSRECCIVSAFVGVAVLIGRLYSRLRSGLATGHCQREPSTSTMPATYQTHGCSGCRHQQRHEAAYGGTSTRADGDGARALAEGRYRQTDKTATRGSGRPYMVHHVGKAHRRRQHWEAKDHHQGRQAPMTGSARAMARRPSRRGPCRRHLV